MMLLIIFCFCILQVACYFFCARFNVISWLDLLLFPVFIFIIIKMLPPLFLPEQEPIGECAFSESGMGRMLFLLFGIPSCVVIFLLNCYFRRGEKPNSQREADRQQVHNRQ